MDPVVEQLVCRRLVALEDAKRGVCALVEVTSAGEIMGLSFVSPNLAGAADARQSLSEALSSTDRDEVARIARSELKGDKLDERVLRNVKNILTSLFATLYTRRSFWRNELSVGPQS